MRPRIIPLNLRTTQHVNRQKQMMKMRCSIIVCDDFLPVPTTFHACAFMNGVIPSAMNVNKLLMVVINEANTSTFIAHAHDNEDGANKGQHAQAT
jgi:hypothetical protein